MSRALRGLPAFGRFWWDFFVGDDWRIAAGVVTALSVTGLLAHHDAAAWWVLPVAVPGLLAASLVGAVRAGRRR